jgi:hypothetical protein
MSDTDSNEEPAATEEFAPAAPSVSYAPGHGPDGPIEGYEPSAPANELTVAEKMAAAIKLLQEIYRTL